MRWEASRAEGSDAIVGTEAGLRGKYIIVREGWYVVSYFKPRSRSEPFVHFEVGRRSTLDAAKGLAQGHANESKRRC